MQTTHIFFGLLDERRKLLLQARGDFAGPPYIKLSQRESFLFHSPSPLVLPSLARRAFDGIADLFEIGEIHPVLVADERFEFEGGPIVARFFHITAPRVIAPRRMDASFDFDPAVRPHDVFVGPFRQLEHAENAPHQTRGVHCAA